MNLSIAFHPQTDGQIERTNQMLEQYLWMYCNHLQDDRVCLFPMVLFAYNNGISASTGHSLFFLNYGYHSQHDISPNDANQVPAAKEYLKKLADAQEKAARLLKKLQKAQTVQYNCKKRETPAFEEEELTLLLQKYIETKRPSTKLDNKKLGPFKILEKIDTHARKLKLLGTMKIHPVFHVSLLEPFRGNPTDPKISRPDPIC